MDQSPHTYHIQNRPDREIADPEQIARILEEGKYIVVSMCRNNEPYIVTLSYGYDKSSHSLYLHGSRKGMKLDFIRENPCICATIIQDMGYVPEQCSHNYQSLILRGTMELVTTLEEKRHGMHTMLEHLEKDPDSIKKLKLKSEAMYEHFTILKLNITQITGKARLG